MSLKPLTFIGPCLDDLQNFPDEARRAVGFELRTVQNGFEPSDWKPISSIGSGVREIRIHTLGEWRVIYIAKLHETIYVLHAFQKKHGGPAEMISNWHENGSNNLEVLHE